MFPFKRRPDKEAEPGQPAAESARADLAAPQKDTGALLGDVAEFQDDAAPAESQAARAAFALAERREHSLVSLIDDAMKARPKPVMFWQYPGGGVGISSSRLMRKLLQAQRAGKPLPEDAKLYLDALLAQGAPFKALRLIGGGARSPLWRQILADVFGLPVLRPRLLVEATSLGAAIAGGVGVGLYPDYSVAGDLVQVEPGEEPRPEVAARYSELYEVFQETYESLTGVYDRIAEI